VRKKDQCAYVHANCEDEESGLLSYLSFYYCTLSGIKPLAGVILILWLCMLFTTIGIAASDFFCVNLSSIATLLGMSENFAGVTFLALGNGSPDVFSTFAAMSSNSGSLAVGELIGAAGFITAVVAGSMAFVRPFKVGRRTFVRDVGFFIVAASFSLSFLYDGKLYLWECATMVGIYAFYVGFVVAWHMWKNRRKRRRLIEARARSQFVVPGSAAMDLEEYRDDDDDDGRPTSRSRTDVSMEDFGALERADAANDDADERDDLRELYIGEINSHMRLNRPRPGERRATHGQIRPSLVGALEFRSVISGLQKARSAQSYALHPRHNSYDDILPRSPDRAQSVSDASESAGHLQANKPHVGERTASGNRLHAISALEPGAANHLHPDVPRIDLLGPIPDPNPELSIDHGDGVSRERLRIPTSPSASPSISISPPPSNESREPSPARVAPSASRLDPGSNIPARGSTTNSSDGSRSPRPPKIRVSPDPPSGEFLQFPTYTDDYFMTSPTSTRSASPFRDAQATRRAPPEELPAGDQRQKPLSRWQRSILPRAQIVLATLFPTLCAWEQKNVWERCLAVVAAPSVMLLTITLPVADISGDDSVDGSAPALNLDNAGAFSHGALASQVYGESGLVGYTDMDHQRETTPNSVGATPPSPTTGSQSSRPALQPDEGDQLPYQVSSLKHSDQDILPEQGYSWNRWLVMVQAFTAPLFIIVVIWANTAVEDPAWLIRPTLISLLVSLVLLSLIILTSTPSRAPTWRAVLCFVGFAVSISWISTIAGEVVGVLKALGVILNISDAILGLTIFAVGNSLSDLVANVTVAKLGFPFMALSACFGGPMLNILLGIGVSGVYITVRNARDREEKHPNSGLKFKPYHVDIDRSLMVSGVALLVTLVGLLIVVPARGWMMDRVVGTWLMSLWGLATIGNVGSEIWLSNKT
jgi:sodium/potassium/calcium exchanger 6